MNKISKEMMNLMYKDRDEIMDINEDLILRFIASSRDFLIMDYIKKDITENDYDVTLKKIEIDTKAMLEDINTKNIDKILESYINSLPEIKRILDTSIEAIYKGDPASYSKQQIVTQYPGFLAILCHRIANFLYKNDLKFPARYISEYAHSKTGIDINPGATIGEYFFIDHGTGIVIGETAVIGNNVKLYQGVTLGALSLSKGRNLQGKKRHPTVEDNVTIYSNAAIFGGDTIIGKNSTIGAVTYITSSIPANSIVLQKECGIDIIDK